MLNLDSEQQATIQTILKQLAGPDFANLLELPTLNKISRALNLARKVVRPCAEHSAAWTRGPVQGWALEARVCVCVCLCRRGPPVPHTTLL